MYEIGIVSKDKIRLTAGAMILHAAGITCGYGDKQSMFKDGRPSGAFKDRMDQGAQGWHVSAGKALHNSNTSRCGDGDTKSKYSVGFFNLDDPTGFAVFARVMGERATAEPLKTRWQLLTTSGGLSRDYVATLYVHPSKGKGIAVGCSFTRPERIRQMIDYVERGRSNSWDLYNVDGHSNGYTARVDTYGKRLVISDVAIVVSLDQLREMLAATA